MYTLTIQKKALKDIKKAPPRIQRKFEILVEDLETSGPVQEHWPNYSMLGKVTYHCHLGYHWVACWRHEKESIVIEVLMRVHAKTPHIDVQITGTGADVLVEMLKKTIKDLKVSTDDETIPVNSDPWFQQLRNSRTSGEVLWCYRDNAGITLDELSQRSGIAKSHLSEMENNKRPIGLKTAKKLAEALGCDFHRFLIA